MKMTSDEALSLATATAIELEDVLIEEISRGIVTDVVPGFTADEERDGFLATVGIHLSLRDSERSAVMRISEIARALAGDAVQIAVFPVRLN